MTSTTTNPAVAVAPERPLVIRAAVSSPAALPRYDAIFMLNPLDTFEDHRLDRQRR